ncbi:MAG TPA: aspartate aminotransferase family protein [Bryobacteraceae bacterium]|nr:aspartate aminotransferase family protein [Bryobacteraceae bacterium]
MTKQEIILANQECLFPSVFHYYQEPLVLTRAKDQFVWDADGNQYLDFFGGILTISVGHCNPKVNAKVHAQVDQLQHVSTVFATEPQASLARKINAIAPGPGWKSFFTNSGTEANETAILAARCYTGSTEIIALRHSYHGRSALAMSLTANAAWRLGPPQAGIVYAHNAYCYRCPFGLQYPDCGLRCAWDVEELIRTTTSGRIAGLIAEPIQGVGGFITPPKEYFPIVAEIVRKYGGIFISDEVQTAWGRTGQKWWGIQHWGVTPDVITSAKGLANGLPIGLTSARPEIAGSLKGLTISTFGGNPVAAAAARAVIELIEEENLAANAAATGAYLRGRLEELQQKHSLIGDVRGMGLMQALELVEDRKSKAPAVSETLRLMEAARQERILIGKGGLFGNVIRISPPLNITTSDVDEFIARLDAAFTRIGAPPSAPSPPSSRHSPTGIRP